MVYLLKSGPYLKIGFTSGPSINHRLHQIRNASPYDIEVLAARPGTYDQEQALHAGAKQWQHRGDWYNDCQELREYCDQFFYPPEEGSHEGTLPEGGGDTPISSLPE
jgi:hypothetical protein